MIKQLEKQLEFEFMEEMRKKEKLEKLLSIMGSVPDWITAMSCTGTLAIMVFYNRVPSVYETVKEYIGGFF